MADTVSISPDMSDSVSVLLVDADVEFAAEAAGYVERRYDRITVETATTAAKGVTQLEQGTFDCVVADCVTGTNDAFDFLEAVRDRDPDRPFIVVAEQDPETVAAESISRGATDYLQKRSGTGQFDLLANRVLNAVERYRAKRAERRLGELTEHTDKILSIFDADWTELQFVNSAYADIWGRSLERLHDDPTDFVNGVHPDDRERVEEAMAALSSGDPVDLECRVNEDEAYGRWVRIWGEPIVEGNEVVRVAGLATEITDQKRQERELRDAKLQLEAAIDAGTVGTWEWDVREDRFVAGPAFAETFGVDPAAAQEGVSLERFVSSIHANDRDRVESAIQAAIDACDSYEQEYRVHNAAGELRWVLARGHVECDEDGTAIRFPGALMDITEKKRAEHELQRHEAFLEESTDIVTVVDAAGTIEYHSPSVDEILGYDSTDVTGTNAFELAHPDDSGELVEAFGDLLGVSGASERAEARFRTADGEWRWLEVHGTNQLANPAVDGIVVNSRDITERKRQERERKALIEFLQWLYDLTTDVDRSLEGKISRLLELGCERLDLPYGFLSRIERREADEPGGTQTIVQAHGTHDRLQPGESGPLSRTYCRETIDSDDLLATADAAADDRYTEEAYEQFELGCYVGGQVRVEDELYGTLCFAADEPREEEFSTGDRMIVRLMNRWVSYELERHRTTAELERANERLERTNERLESFASVVSHDLRNPLNVASGHLELARTNQDSDHLEEADAALDRIETLVDDLLTLARQGDSAVEPEPVSLPDLVDDCWRSVETGNAALHVETDRTISADRTRLQQLLENLVRNAVEHGSTSPRSQTPEDAVEHGSTSHAEPDSSADAIDHGGEGVTVTIADVDGGFAVEDDGPGIPPEERDRVFEPGYTTEPDGTGLGLRIVEDVVDDHDWSIDVVDGNDGGARFDVTGVDVLESANDEGDHGKKPADDGGDHLTESADDGDGACSVGRRPSGTDESD
ncbi:PAS domain-containing protein [Natrialba swarupiae]|uniref:histidine kinase n=2 Tax=Natrialba swarupiae TaxID=2448032 RepID=A0A5D5ANS5_9EURY|nr:PAS domain-containing protein [Natrialba swarupiae]